MLRKIVHHFRTMDSVTAGRWNAAGGAAMLAALAIAAWGLVALSWKIALVGLVLALTDLVLCTVSDTRKKRAEEEEASERLARSERREAEAAAALEAEEAEAWTLNEVHDVVSAHIAEYGEAYADDDLDAHALDALEVVDLDRIEFLRG